MRKRLKILLWSDIMFMVAGGMLGPLYAVYVENIGGDILAVGGAWAAFAFATGILILLMGKVEQHRNKILLIIGGATLKAVAFIGYIFVSNPYELVGIEILLGVGVAVSIPAQDALYAKLIDKGKETFSWALWEGSYYVTSAIAGLFGAGVVEYFGFKALFLLMAAASVVGVFFAIDLLNK